jgi:hypothetical protein
MQNRSDYWTAWMAGWAAATKTIIEAQQRALSLLLPPQPAPRAAANFAETAGNKPSEPTPRRRGRPRKSESAQAAAPRRRGRPPKAGRAKA